ncbi:MAG: radical SAM protein [Holophagales bacterium]|nr:radical SAM protein [Holophagales bacterium]
MSFTLSHYGLRYVRHLGRSVGDCDPGLLDRVRPLFRAYAHLTISEDDGGELEALLAGGFLERVPDDVDPGTVRTRYARNPLEHLTRVAFEYTTLCNLDCRHCRNGGLEAQTETHPEALRRVVDAAIPIGLTRFDFIGGEVTLFGKGWLDLVRYIRSQGGLHVSVLTSGWFLGETNFLAAGRRYADDGAYFRELRESGLTHVVFSLDGPEETHDEGRRTPGLYRRVLEGFSKVRAAGLVPRVSLVLGLGATGAAMYDWLAGVSSVLYGPVAERDYAVARLLDDDDNYVSNLVDVGTCEPLGRATGGIGAFTDEELRCRNFFRPRPSLRIKASGEVSLCPLVEAGDGYGNVHTRDVVDILNHLHEAFVYRLHAEKRVGEVRPFLDPGLFGSEPRHACGVRTALNMLGRAMEERGVAQDDHEAIRAINVEVAGKMGILPREIRNRAIGRPRPR